MTRVEILILRHDDIRSVDNPNILSDFYFEFLSIYNNFHNNKTLFIASDNFGLSEKHFNILNKLKSGDFIKCTIKENKFAGDNDTIMEKLSIDDLKLLSEYLKLNFKLKNISYIEKAKNKSNQLLRQSKLKNILDE
jgi:hypothetical protein